jgi:hypothetical protein
MWSGFYLPPFWLLGATGIIMGVVQVLKNGMSRRSDYVLFIELSPNLVIDILPCQKIRKINL